MESLSHINLYDQLLTLMVLCMVNQWFSCSFEKNFRQTTFNFLFVWFQVIQKSWKLQNLPMKMAVSNFQSLIFHIFARKERPSSFVLACPILDHCRLYFSGMGFHKIVFCNSRQPKMNVDDTYYVLQSYYCQKFRTSHFKIKFSMSISTEIFVH